MRMSRRLCMGGTQYDFYDIISNSMLDLRDTGTGHYWEDMTGTNPYIDTGITSKKIKIVGEIRPNGLIMGTKTGAVLLREFTNTRPPNMGYSGYSCYNGLELGPRGCGFWYANDSGFASVLSYTYQNLPNGVNYDVSADASSDIPTIKDFVWRVAINSSTLYKSKISMSNPAGYAEIDAATWTLFSYPPRLASANKVYNAPAYAFAGSVGTLTIKDLDTNKIVAKLIPARRVVDGAIGMYCDVRKIFCPAHNGGNGTPTSFTLSNI